MNKVIFTIEEYDEKNNAGPKAKVDVDYFLSKKGFKVIHQHFDIHSKIKKLFYRLITIPRLFNGQHYDELIFQYPTYSSFLMKKMVPKMREHTDKLYFLVHDVESLRIFTNDQKYWEGEKALFNSTDGLIVHDSKMHQWLFEHGITVPMVELGIFDYHNPQPIQKDENYQRSICFAGNLSKSSFLNELSLKRAQLHIYGPYPEKQYLPGVTYKGIYSPDELPKHLTENFGLVWDGSSAQTCDGKYGNYLRYNAPHKTSLYLSTGIPVIIWKQAALAEFVIKHHVGIVVDSLEDIDTIITNMTSEQYSKMKNNAIKLAEELRGGHFCKQAVSLIEKY